MCDKMFANNAAVKQHMQEVRSTVFNLRKFSLIHFDKNFVKATQLKEKSLESWFDDIFFFDDEREILVFRLSLIHWEKIREINSYTLWPLLNRIVHGSSD